MVNVLPAQRGSATASDTTGKALSSAMLTLAMFPYLTLAPLGIPSQVQPWTALFSWLGIVTLLARGLLIFRWHHAAVLAFTILFMLYVEPSSEISGDYYVRKSSSFFISFAIVIIAQYLHPESVVKIVKFTALVWLFFALFGLMAPAPYLTVVQLFVPTASGMTDERGVTSLAPEATDFGFTMVVVLVIYMLAARKLSETGNTRAPRWVYIALFVNIGLSKSASGIFALLFIYAAYFLSNMKKQRPASRIFIYIMTPFIVALAYFCLMAIDSTGIRGVDLMLTAARSPIELINTTFSYRLAHNIVGLLGLVDSNLLGYGAGSFISRGILIYHSYGVGELLGLEGWYATNVPYSLQLQPLAFFPVIFFENGIFGVMFCYMIFSRVLKSRIVLNKVVALMMFLTWAQSFPAAFPLFWVFLGLADNRRFFATTKATESQLAHMPRDMHSSVRPHPVLP